ncbi:UNVERIFIED_CONTAM: cytochrome P450, partial [Bacteroidetes bacterium 56_B9]
DPAQHSRHRKLLGKGFTQNYLRSNWEGRIQEQAESLIQYLKSDAKNSSGEVDIYKWLPLFAGDVVAELAFGQSFGMMERGKPDEIITY